MGRLDRRLEAAGLALVAATVAALLIVFVLTLRTDASASTVSNDERTAHLTESDAPAGLSGDAE